MSVQSKFIWLIKAFLSLDVHLVLFWNWNHTTKGLLIIK